MVILSMWGSSASGAYGSGSNVNGISILLLTPLSLFERMGEPEHRGLVEMPRQNLHPYRQLRGRGSARYAHARNARQAAGDGVDIGKIHGERVVQLFPQFERRKRRYRRNHGVYLLKGTGEISRNQRAHA